MSRLAAWVDDLNVIKDTYTIRLGEKQAIENNIATLNLAIDGHKQKQDQNKQVAALLQKGAELARNNAKTYLEEVGTTALQFVLDKDVNFEIEMADKAGRAEAEFYIKYTDGSEVVRVRPDDSCGGGVIDTLSTSLRFGYMEQLKEPSIQSCVIFDEPGKMISEVASNKMAALLNEFKATFNRQTIMVTHNDAYGAVADKEYTVSMAGVESKVVEGIVQAINGVGDTTDVSVDGYTF